MYINRNQAYKIKAKSPKLRTKNITPTPRIGKKDRLRNPASRQRQPAPSRECNEFTFHPKWSALFLKLQLLSQ